MPVNSKQQVLEQINEANARAFTLDDLTFGPPQPYVGSVERNTSVVLTPHENTGLTGTAIMYYNRLELGVLFAAINTNFDYNVAHETTHNLLPMINARFNLALEADDIIDEPLIVMEGFPKPQTLRANSTSFGYLGEMTLNLERPAAVNVVTAEELADAFIGWDLSGAILDGAFISSDDYDGSRSGEIGVAGRARLASESVAPTPTTLSAEETGDAVEDLYTIDVNPNTGNWFIDLGARMGNFDPAMSLEQLYDVSFEVFHSNPATGSLTYRLEKVDGAYRFRDATNSHVLAVDYNVDGHLVSTSVDMKALAATTGWALNFTDVPKTTFGAPYHDADLYPGWLGFKITATGLEDESGTIYVGADVSASFMVDVQAVLSNQWITAIASPAINTFEDGLVFNGDWYLDSTWAQDGTQSLRSANIVDNGTSSTWIDVIDGTGQSVAFNYKISSEANYDFLEVYINAEQVFVTSGESLGYKSFPLAPGPNNIEWRYLKDSSADGGLDAAWIDNVELMATPIPAVVLPMERGILASNPFGTLVTTAPDKSLEITDVDKPSLTNSAWAVLNARYKNEIYAIDGHSASLTIHYSGDGALNFKSQTITTHKLASNSSVFFKGSLYFAGQLMADSTYGIYRLNRTGVGESATFAIQFIRALVDINVTFAASDNYLAVFDGLGRLYHSIDGQNFIETAMMHPAETVNKIYRVQMTFDGDTLIGIGIDAGFNSPPVMAFIGVPGQTFTWKAVDPWGDARDWNFTEARLATVDSKVILAVSGPTNNVAKIIETSDQFTTCSIALDDTGIYPMSIADDGVVVMVTGYQEKAGVGYHWMAYSLDRCATWVYDPDGGSFFGQNAQDYTFAVGVKMAELNALTRGFLFTNSTSVSMSENLVDYQVIEDPNALKTYASSSRYGATVSGNQGEIFILDGTTSMVKLSASFDAGDTFATQNFTPYRLVSNSAVFFRGQAYVVLQHIDVKFPITYGLYRIVWTGGEGGRQFDFELVVHLPGVKPVLAADENFIVVLDSQSTLHYSVDAVSWAKQLIQHPYSTGGATPDITKVALAMVNGVVAGVCMPTTNDVTAPNLALFRGIPGGTMTWVNSFPYAMADWTYNNALLSNVDGNLLLVLGYVNDAATAPEVSSYGDILLTPDVGDTWETKSFNTGIYPWSISDDGTIVVVSGSKAGLTGGLWWMGYSKDRCQTWIFETNTASPVGKSYNAATLSTPRLAGEAIPVPGPADIVDAPSPFEPLPSFTGADATVHKVAVLSDDTILIGGDFLNYDGVPHLRMAKLNADGSTDHTYVTNIDNKVMGFVVQPDDKAIIFGIFNNVDGVARNRIARLNTDGSLDTTFVPPVWVDKAGGQGVIWNLALQPDGKVLVAGNMYTVDGTVHEALMRLNTDGTLDPTFTTYMRALNESAPAYTFSNVYVLNNGVILACLNNGGAYLFDSVGAQNGTMTIYNGVITALYEDAFNVLTIFGYSIESGGTSTKGTARFTPVYNGEVFEGYVNDPTYTLVMTGYSQSGEVKSIVEIPGVGLLLGGNQTKFHGTDYTNDLGYDYKHLTLIDYDGNILTEYLTGRPNSVITLARQFDGTIVTGGSAQYVIYGGYPRTRYEARGRVSRFTLTFPS